MVANGYVRTKRQHNFPYIYHPVPPFPIFSPSVKTTVTPLQRTPPVPRALEDGDNASAASSGASGSRSSTRQLSGAQSHGSTERDRLASASARLQRRMGRCGCSGWGAWLTHLAGALDCLEIKMEELKDEEKKHLRI